MPGGRWGGEIVHGQLGAGNMERNPETVTSADLGQCSVLLEGRWKSVHQRNKARDKLCGEEAMILRQNVSIREG